MFFPLTVEPATAPGQTDGRHTDHNHTGKEGFGWWGPVREKRWGFWLDENVVGSILREGETDLPTGRADPSIIFCLPDIHFLVLEPFFSHSQK